MARNHTACTQQGSTGRQRKAGTFRLTANHIFWVIRVQAAKKGEERQESLASNVTFGLFCSYYHEISFTDKKYPSHTYIMTLLI